MEPILQVLLILFLFRPWDDLLWDPLDIVGHTSIHNTHAVNNSGPFLEKVPYERVLLISQSLYGGWMVLGYGLRPSLMNLLHILHNINGTTGVGDGSLHT